MKLYDHWSLLGAKTRPQLYFYKFLNFSKLMITVQLLKINL